MDCGQCEGIERETRDWAVQDLKRYRSGKPVKTTTLLIQALQALGVQDLTVLDIGGGIGAIQLELLAAGAGKATSVDASAAYIEVAKEEAARKGVAEQISYLHGDFVALANQVPPADIVTLDRVICCYHDARALVDLSAARAQRLYGLVYPRDRWWNRLMIRLENLICRLKRSPFRAFVHPTSLVEGLVRRNGLKPVFQKNTFIWQVVVYSRG
jgi:magnesium-protoporphyrin O-methyltransferase